jgi:hypothetical protein
MNIPCKFESGGYNAEQRFFGVGNDSFTHVDTNIKCIFSVECARMSHTPRNREISLVKLASKLISVRF